VETSQKMQGKMGSLPERIRQLVDSEHYGVLCTQGDGQPYGSLIAFAFSDDLKTAVFATPTTTRKYRLLSQSPRVAMVVDSRTQSPEEMHQIEAITVTGQAVELDSGQGFDKWAKLLVDRHRQLRPFVEADTTALFRIDVVRYFHVTRFQEVRQWIPTLDM
jgi:nitroimidazol reductase NimA-like FMN-containing flavoprotein (pyridoxamine 5'-phosphate oxidase superfamily)